MDTDDPAAQHAMGAIAAQQTLIGLNCSGRPRCPRCSARHGASGTATARA